MGAITDLLECAIAISGKVAAKPSFAHLRRAWFKKVGQQSVWRGAARRKGRLDAALADAARRGRAPRSGRGVRGAFREHGGHGPRWEQRGVSAHPDDPVLFARAGGDWTGHVLTGDAVLAMPVIGVDPPPLAEVCGGGCASALRLSKKPLCLKPSVTACVIALV